MRYVIVVRGRRAFTIIEMLVVLGIVGILASLLLPALISARSQGRRTQCVSNLKQIGAALVIYENSFDGYLPSYPGWGLRQCQITLGSQKLVNYAEHQGASRHMVIALSDEVDDPQALTPGNLNFMPVGLGVLVARETLGANVLVCPSMTSSVPTWYGAAEYRYVSDMPKRLGQTPSKPLSTSDGRRFLATTTGTGRKTVAVLSSYAYRNKPFYARTLPDNAPRGWTYSADYPDLADWSTPARPWLAEWKLEFVQPEIRAQFMTPPFRTEKQLGNRAICADSFDLADESSGGFPSGVGMARWHHKGGYNVLYGDGHATWYDDDDGMIKTWSDWTDPANPGTDNLTISSPSAQRVWNLFDRAAGVDVR